MSNEAAHVSELSRVILTTPRLVLRTTVKNDISILHARILGDAEVMRYVSGGGAMDPEQAEAFIRNHFTFGPGLTGIGVLTERRDDGIIGFAGLLSCDALGADDFEIGFVLARQAWGRGIATEIGEAQLTFGFETVRSRRMLGLVEPRNAPSVHALKKLGLRYLKDVRYPQRASRSVYVIEADEWNRRGERV